MKYRATPIEFQSSLSLFPQPGWSWMQSQAYLFEKNGSRARERENRVQVNGFQDISQSGVQNKYRTNSLRFWITIHRWKNAKASIPFLPIPAAIGLLWSPSVHFIEFIVLRRWILDFKGEGGGHHVPRHEYCAVTMAHARNGRFIVTRVDFTPFGDGLVEGTRSIWSWRRYRNFLI